MKLGKRTDAHFCMTEDGMLLIVPHRQSSATAVAAPGVHPWHERVSASASHMHDSIRADATAAAI